MLDAAPARLREIFAACPDPSPVVYTALLAGWSTRAGRAVAYTLASSDRFEPAPLPDGQALCPTVSTAAPDYPRLYELSTRAGKGRKLAEAFLLAAAANQMRTFRRGLYGGGMAFGGPLRLAEVAERGLESWEVGEA